MSIVITGATGQLGRLVVEALLDLNVPAGQLVATGRDLAKLDDLADRGVQVRAIDYSDSASLREAFSGADKVLLVSGSEVGQRLPQHLNVIAAAKEAGVSLIAYTSIANADTTGMALAAEHQATEVALRESGMPFVLLRNGWYLENYTEQLGNFLQHGAVLGSAGEGRVSAASRADYAHAAAAALLGDDQAGKVYELGGDTAFTLGELAESVTAATSQPVIYQQLPAEDYTQALVGAGVPEQFAQILTDSDLGIARGDLLVTGGALQALIGRPSTPLSVAVQAAAEALSAAKA
ncbi:SDR family oxidoreductase [Arthrobacter sp. BF1]|uniref:SDR family oxidoreductase n=1 Tax=Arthrobacter sp. BF1 TaxID=2821145 RepID=UPI001C4EF9AA|nr:SDR family oxidoreductase [Arthrobacter sp. BF1]